MEYRQLGASGFFVPVLSFGTATFGGGNEFFKARGNTDVAEAKHCSIRPKCTRAVLPKRYWAGHQGNTGLQQFVRAELRLKA